MIKMMIWRIWRLRIISRPRRPIRKRRTITIRRMRRIRRIKRLRRLGMIRRRIDNTTTRIEQWPLRCIRIRRMRRSSRWLWWLPAESKFKNVCLVHLSHMGSHQSHSHIESHHPSEARNGPNPGLVSLVPFRYSRFDLPRLEFGGAAVCHFYCLNLKHFFSCER